MTPEQARCISVTRAALWLKEWGSQEETWQLLFKTKSIAVSLVGKYNWKYKWSPKKVLSSVGMVYMRIAYLS